MDAANPIEDRLLHAALVRPGQMAEASVRAAQSGKTIWAELVRVHALTEEALTRFFGQELGVPYVNPADYQPDLQLALKIGEELARTHLLVPLCVVDQTAFVAIANPTDVAALDEIRHRTGLSAEPLIATGTVIRQMLDELYGIEDRCGEALGFVEPQRVRGIGSQETREHPRVRVDLEVHVSLVTASVRLQAPQPMAGTAEDLSLGGARVRLPYFLPRGTEVSLALPMRSESHNTPQETLHLRARVTHCATEGLSQATIRAGLQFLQILPEARVQLERLLAYVS